MRYIPIDLRISVNSKHTHKNEEKPHQGRAQSKCSIPEKKKNKNFMNRETEMRIRGDFS